MKYASTRPAAGAARPCGTTSATLVMPPPIALRPTYPCPLTCISARSAIAAYALDMGHERHARRPSEALPAECARHPGAEAVGADRERQPGRCASSPSRPRMTAPATRPPSMMRRSSDVDSSTSTPRARAARTSAWSSSRRAIDSPRPSGKRPTSRAPRAAVTLEPLSVPRPPEQSAAVTPSRSSIRTASGLMYSEQAFSRGNAARSIASTRQPASASREAVALPAGPAPITRASVTRSVTGRGSGGRTAAPRQPAGQGAGGGGQLRSRHRW